MMPDATAQASDGPALAWDAISKDCAPAPGKKNGRIVFTATNRSQAEIVITDAIPSCKCVIVRLPSRPWRLAAGASGELQIEVNFAGKRGVVTETVWVETTRGPTELKVRARLPDDFPTQK